MKKLIAAILQNKTGSVLPIMAAAIVPIAITIGASIDFSRANLAEAKLQEAVDSAALAGRRTMTNENLESAKEQINSYMEFNFPPATMGSGDLTTEITKPDVGTVRVSAKTSIDTSLLRLIGIETLPIEAIGEATQNLDNVDIVLVLDTTGSMNNNLDGRKKIETLREAVQSLYGELEGVQKQLEDQNLRLRIGVVPYSGTVNVGKILAEKDTDYLQSDKVQYYHWKKKGKSWNFGQVEQNLSGYIRGGALGNRNGHFNYQNERWKGCIEERATTPSITGDDSRITAPAEAFDLDIDMIPGSNDETKWKPYIFDPLNGNPNTFCPSEVTLLASLDSGDIDNIVNNLVPSGSTYHDIGMIWGARLISSGGIFGNNNPSTFNGRPVNRYIIYMTDGQISTPVTYCASTSNRRCRQTTRNYSRAYSAYGIEAFDKRVGASSTSDNNRRHTKRFQMACAAAKAKQISIWTIAFGTSEDVSLTKCASNADQASTINDSDELIDKFAEIGRNIGTLRLSK